MLTASKLRSQQVYSFVRAKQFLQGCWVAFVDEERIFMFKIPERFLYSGSISCASIDLSNLNMSKLGVLRLSQQDS
jgi:hypothetical protein